MPGPPDGDSASFDALVLERHGATRLGFGLLLRSQPWISGCTLASDREEAVALARRGQPDVAIVDITEAGISLGSYLAPLVAVNPAMALVLSTRHIESELGAPLPLGAAGLITPRDSVDETVKVVRQALSNEPPPALSARPAQAYPLSAREREVLMLLRTGATNREIADSLHVSAETVKKHAAMLYRKLGVRNRTEAAQVGSGG